MEKRLVTVASHLSPQEAAVMRSRLEAEGITVYTRDEQAASNILGVFSDSLVGGVKLEVSSSDEERAREILAAIHEEPGESRIDAYRVRTTRSFLLASVATVIFAAVLFAANQRLDTTPFALLAGGFAAVLAAFVIGSRIYVHRCSSCLNRVAAGEVHCPQCGAALLADVRSLSEATAARLAREDEGAQ